MEINQHHIKRYHKFIVAIRKLGKRTLDYQEVHHIIPTCLGGSDSQDNLITLSLREHFVAHWMLSNAYSGTFSIMSAFYQMCNKTPKIAFKRRHLKFEHGVISRVYEKKKKQLYQLLSDLMTGWMWVTNIETGAKVKVSAEQYKQDQSNTVSVYSFHTKGKYVCLDTIENKMVSIPCEMYHSDKIRYVMKVNNYNYIDQASSRIVSISKAEARELNHQLGHTRYKQVVNAATVCIDKNGKKITMLSADYDPTMHQHILKGTFTVFDLVSLNYKHITSIEYDYDRHSTNTRGKVVAKDKHGKSCLVSVEQYKSGEYTGITKGLTMVKEKASGKNVQISNEEFHKNKNLYEGLNAGKSAVINIITGKRMMLPKLQVNKSLHVNLGKNNQYFKAKNKFTNQIKNVSIYEWNKTIMDSHWRPLDDELFEKRRKLLN